MELERAIYTATSPLDHNSAVLAKCEVRKQQGLYKEALAELSRIYIYALGEEQSAQYYSQRALCGYLAADFDTALATIDEAAFYTPRTPMLILIEALSAGEKGLWERSERAAKEYLALLPDGDTRTSAVETLYANAPALRNPMTAYWLSLVPGLGQFYAGEVWSGIVSLAVNGALGGFAVSEFLVGQWISGYVVGCGLLSNTYFVGQERARTLTERRNKRLLRTHNDLLREVLLAQ